MKIEVVIAVYDAFLQTALWIAERQAQHSDSAWVDAMRRDEDLPMRLTLDGDIATLHWAPLPDTYDPGQVYARTAAIPTVMLGWCQSELDKWHERGMAAKAERKRLDEVKRAAAAEQRERETLARLQAKFGGSP